MSVEFRKFITREMVRNEPEKIFVFGDNVIEHGFGGQAKEMRGEKNAYGIPTKWKPTMEQDAFFRDFQFPAVKLLLSQKFNDLELFNNYKGNVVVWPEDGIGTGLSKLSSTSPLAWNYIEQRLAILRGIDFYANS